VWYALRTALASLPTVVFIQNFENPTNANYGAGRCPRRAIFGAKNVNNLGAHYGWLFVVGVVIDVSEN